MERPTACCAVITLLAGPTGLQEAGPSLHHDQRGGDKNEVFLQVISRCLAFLSWGSCPPWSASPWVSLSHLYHGADVPPRLSWPPTFPTDISYLLFGALLPHITQVEGNKEARWGNYTPWSTLLKSGGPWLPGNLFLPHKYYMVTKPKGNDIHKLVLHWQ